MRGSTGSGVLRRGVDHALQVARATYWVMASRAVLSMWSFSSAFRGTGRGVTAMILSAAR